MGDLNGDVSQAVGDIDGDGSTDLLCTVFSAEEPTDGVVYLLPGAMRAPE